MTGNIVSRRYAKALFVVGQKQGDEQLAAYGQELQELAEALLEAPEAMSFFRNPTFNPGEKKSVMNQIVEKTGANAMVKNFCDLLADKDRLSVLPAIAADYNKMLDESQGIISGEMVTAKPLADDRKAELKKRLEEQTGKKLELEFADNAEILGGVVLKIGDKVLDASLRAQLQILKENIKRGE